MKTSDLDRRFRPVLLAAPLFPPAAGPPFRQLLRPAAADPQRIRHLLLGPAGGAQPAQRASHRSAFQPRLGRAVTPSWAAPFRLSR